MTPPFDVRLRDACRGDMEVLFALQSDEASARMAMVVPRSREAFEEVWSRVLTNREAGTPGVVAKVIVLDEEVVGSIGCFDMNGLLAVGYGVARRHWGRGIASRALALLLEEMPVRPLHACCAASNLASLRVLTRNGFVVTGTRWSPGTERYLACEEVSLVLTAPGQDR